MSVNEYSVREKYHRLTMLLIERNLMITAMESATSGQIASLLTDTEGSSAIFKGSFVTYSNEAKIRMGVPEDIIRTYSVYSAQTAEAMAERCAAFYNADIGIGVTGTMGNIDPANADDSIPGYVYFAVYFRGAITSHTVKIEPQRSRLLYKLAAAETIADTLLSLLS
jgi:PncC family amidohydrolase